MYLKLLNYIIQYYYNIVDLFKVIYNIDLNSGWPE